MYQGAVIMLKRIFDAVKASYSENLRIADAYKAVNIERLRYICPFILAINTLGIFFFLISDFSPDRTVQLWLDGLLFAHTFTAVIFVVICFFMKTNAHRMHGHLGMVLLYISVSSVMALAVSTAVFDQLVTSSITPYLIVSLTVGMIIIVSPYHALAVYFFPTPLFS